VLSQAINENVKQSEQGAMLGYVAVLLVAMMGAAITTLMPLIIGAFSDAGILNAQQVSIVTASDVAGILLSSASAYFWVRRCNWHLCVVVGLTIFILANFVTAYIEGFYLLMLTRFIAGVACGVCYSISLAALGDRANPDKAFGDMVTAQVIFGTVGFTALPYFIEISSYAGIYLFFNIFLVLALLVVFKEFPTNNRVQQHFDINLSGIWQPTLLVFLGIVAYYFAQGAVWAYLERIGVDAGLTGRQIGLILAVGFGISAVGSALSGWFVKRLARELAIWITLAIQLPCLAVLYFMTPESACIIYAVATITYQIFWSFVIPVMMGIFSDIDNSGRLIVFCVSAFKIGLLLGTPFAGYLVSNGSLYDVIWVGAIAIFVSSILLVAAHRMIKKQA